MTELVEGLYKNKEDERMFTVVNGRFGYVHYSEDMLKTHATVSISVSKRLREAYDFKLPIQFVKGDNHE